MPAYADLSGCQETGRPVRRAKRMAAPEPPARAAAAPEPPALAAAAPPRKSLVSRPTIRHDAPESGAGVSEGRRGRTPAQNGAGDLRGRRFAAFCVDDDARLIQHVDSASNQNARAVVETGNAAVFVDQQGER